MNLTLSGISIPSPLGRFLGLAAVLSAIIWVLLSKELPGRGGFVDELQNSGHSLVFTVVALCFAWACGPLLERLRTGPVGQNVLIVVLCGLCGAAVELIQAHIGREASWYDFSLDIAGSIVGLCVFSAVDSRKPLKQRRICAVSAVLLLCLCFMLPLVWIYAGVKRNQAFPVIADFESRWTHLYIKPNCTFNEPCLSSVAVVPAPQAWAENASQVVKVDIQPSRKWPGLLMKEPFPDWSAYSTMEFDIFSEQQDAFVLIFRVNDIFYRSGGRDKYEIELSIAPGHQHFSISLDELRVSLVGREMDMTQIARLVWYLSEPVRGRVFYIDNILLRR